VGGTEQFADDLAQATGAIGRLGPDAPAADGNAAAAFLRTLPFVSGAVGAVGYCFGGGVVWRMGVRNPELAAIVPYYGPPPPLDEVPNLRAAALGIYAELDSRINGASEALWEALRAAEKTFELWIAPGANHAFFNNTGANYAPEVAVEAWLRTLGWFDQYLGGRPLTEAQPDTGEGGAGP
jgi:carboxymethylenebutenolidase